MNAPKRLYNEHEALNDAGKALEDAVETHLRSYFQMIQESGFSMRDAENIATNTIRQMIAEQVLIAAVRKVRKAIDKLPKI